MADNIKLPSVLYRKTVPGLLIKGAARNPLIQFLYFDVTSNVGSGSCPTDMVRRSCIVNSLRKGETLSGRSLGKKETTLSDNLILFSLIANPIAVDVKDLLAEYIECFRSFL